MDTSSSSSPQPPAIAASSASASPSSSPALTPEEWKEFNDLRRQNQLLKAENAMLQRKLEEERSHRLQWQSEGDHNTAEAAMCCESIEKMDKDAQVLALYAELHRLREKCDVYAEAVEESRSYFFEMKRLYTEVEPHLRSSGVPPATSSA
ncbi:hypothetical protein ABB37_07851 [Leptomonas pyrrhocoris]|uniref:Uncharacterized protein n=1 Tax=Leptomonas pyrrhocoris TaxID=157538 RepID=A0A0M9FV41_LEPPY|nr:hypothetical protein ABB37_07851 [Leptomonas pyrrhocoris]XP_015655005.1 hypothetical protein ABB37_07851 [Leptomonas pyrrhocoris]XP_015655006.1 hypothetical protein ABB37_07851 [Leptomonas pyrrhocoris]KPA76565.1 hypothetical protein ABB37_07851 [Leptomonas pyrrhocoris]KPA76566.1 hypothetical protein ABB37_07851 [Leptomonas pyrrhocoris]KPA76567.1 hypothetical protein ABB37_07851 [Leptomonas pyrrhocoris]|eukprot:XP_015655004.1 hypothetical protein ABB37_07851 [Leptomonas pyrrhocoris]